MPIISKYTQAALRRERWSRMLRRCRRGVEDMEKDITKARLSIEEACKERDAGCLLVAKYMLQEALCEMYPECDC